MTPAPFDYLRPDCLDAALEALSEAGDDARPLAGGQSLMPLLATRLARPSIVIDIARLPELYDEGREADGRLATGALTRHRDLILSPAIAARLPLLGVAARQVAHPGVRNLGTLGGALALGDPAAEYPACAIALEATIRLASKAGVREVPAEDFFTGPITTAARPDELVTALVCDPLGPDDRFGFNEITERRGDYALAGAAIVARTGAARGPTVRTVLFGVADRPLPVPPANALLAEASPPWDAGVLAAAADATRQYLTGEGFAPERRHLAGVALTRAANDLAAPGVLT